MRKLLAPLALVLAGCAAEGDRPGMEILPGMVDSGSVRSYDPSSLRPGSPAMLLPPSGTAPLGARTLFYGPGPEEARRAGLELTNPFEPTEANLARGKQVFENTCVVCHGARGEGDGPVIGNGRFPNPPSLLAAKAKGLPDGRVFHIITRGQGIMPAHGGQVLPDDRWKAVLYVRSLQEIAPPGAAPNPAPASTVAAANLSKETSK